MLKIENLSKGFNTQSVLHGLNLEVLDGSIFGLVGINGAGKSTLLRTIAGVYEPEEGQVLLNGKNTWTDAEIKKEIAFVSDETYYPLAATISSMKCMYEDLYDFDEQEYIRLLSIFDLNPKKQISSFSKGMKRKAALLFALSTHPKLILLDEAYDGLEPLTRFKVKQILAEKIEEENTSIIISSHSLKELEDICDSFGILQNGSIMEAGDLQIAKDEVNKYQVAFNEEKKKSDFSGLNLLHYEKEGQVYQLIIKGDRKETEQKLEAMHPLLLNVLPVNFEELFIYEVEHEEEDHA